MIAIIVLLNSFRKLKCYPNFYCGCLICCYLCSAYVGVRFDPAGKVYRKGVYKTADYFKSTLKNSTSQLF